MPLRAHSPLDTCQNPVEPRSLTFELLSRAENFPKKGDNVSSEFSYFFLLETVNTFPALRWAPPRPGLGDFLA